jgi:hypothetical protein
MVKESKSCYLNGINSLEEKFLALSDTIRYNSIRECSYSLMAKHSNGNAEIQVRFLVGAP